MMKTEAPKITKESSPVHESVETHPAYGQVWASRISGASFLYGSDFLHHGYIEITISSSELHRGLSNDWPHARKEYIQIALSEAQWATFVSTLNGGTGTQCTVRHIQGEDKPEIEHAPKRKQQFSEEYFDHLKSARNSIKEAEAMLKASGLSEKKIREIMSPLNAAHSNIGGNLGFVSDQFGEHMEKVTEHAKIEANAYIQHVISRAGIKALSQPPILMLTENGDSEETGDDTDSDPKTL